MGLFDLFSKKGGRSKEKADLSLLSTDVHSHLIPGIDDGSPDMETSLSLLRELERLGYRKVITTPHVRAEVYPNDVNELESLCDNVRHSAKQAGIGLDIEVGAEHLIDEGFMERIEKKLFKTFCGNCLLVELPFVYAPMGLNECIFSLQLAGYRLILAHPERYLYWEGEFERFEHLKDQGVLFQANIMSFGGYFGKQVQALASRLAKNDMIELLGSDLHGQRHIEAIENSLHSADLIRLINSGNIINKEF